MIQIEKSSSEAIREAVSDENVFVTEYPVIEHLKAVKNAVELEGFRQCHIRDGAALVGLDIFRVFSL